MPRLSVVLEGLRNNMMIYNMQDINTSAETFRRLVLRRGSPHRREFLNDRASIILLERTYQASKDRG